MLKILNAGLLMLMVSACDCGPPECFDLVWNPTTETCDCPMGTMPNYDLQVCEGVDGEVIPWSDIAPGARPIQPRVDAGAGDGGPDATTPDAGPDLGVVDGGADTFDLGAPDLSIDVGPLPNAVVARFPWNGFNTGSPHVPDATPIVNHPLRPRLSWDVAPGASSYQVQMTRGCPIDGFRDCSFETPDFEGETAETVFAPADSLDVSRVAPVGDRYFWRVRACNGAGCSEWTEPRYLNVGRDPRDFNGDGYADLAVGAPGNDTSNGAAFVYFGSAAGIPRDPGVSISSPITNDFPRFAERLDSAGDINGDGFADLIISTPWTDTRRGTAYVYLGQADGLPAMPSSTLARPLIPANGLFADSVAGVGDVNGDGYDDFVVGAPAQWLPEEGEGTAYLYYGSIGGAPLEASVTIDNPLDQIHGWFAASVDGAGDVNGDGFADIIIGAWQNGDGLDGRAYMFMGAPEGIAPVPTNMMRSRIGDPSGHFGGAVAGAGDVNGDGFADVVVGAAGESSPEEEEGHAYVFLGSRDGVPELSDASIDHPDDVASGQFGLSLGGAGDVNGDGFADIIVGAPAFGVSGDGAGIAYVFQGSMRGTSPVPLVTLMSPLNRDASNTAWDVAGVGDADGDGFTEVVVGAPRQTQVEFGEGVVLLHVGGPMGSVASPSRVMPNPAHDVGGDFGTAL